MLTGKERDDWIEEQYRRYGRRRLIGFGILVVSVGIIIALFLSSPSSGFGQFIGVFEIVTLTVFSSVVVSAYNLLPPVEDRALYRLKHAVTNLKAYSSHGLEDYKEKSVKDFMKVADVSDLWNWGNLKFIREGVGNAIVEFRKNFRGCFIPAVKKSNRTSVQSFFGWLTGFQNSFELGQLDQAHFTAWNQWCSQFPYVAPSPSLSKRMKSKKSQLSFAAVLVASPLVTYIVALDFSHTTVDTAFLATATVFAGVLAAIGLLGRAGQKSS